MQSTNMDVEDVKSHLAREQNAQNVPKAMQLTIDLPTNPAFLQVHSRRCLLLIAPALCPKEHHR